MFRPAHAIFAWSDSKMRAELKIVLGYDGIESGQFRGSWDGQGLESTLMENRINYSRRQLSIIEIRKEIKKEPKKKEQARSAKLHQE